MYDKEVERQKAYAFVSKNLQLEEDLDKKQKFQRAIDFAMDEVAEFEQLLEDFKKRVGHLHVYRLILAPHFEEFMQHSLKSLRTLIEKNYTQEELDQMPESVYNQVVEIQKKRVELLRNIAKTYFTGRL
ncbi:hypothetical protein [Alicyclobacillus shizuokensis]|uniref:hypothetical protein n=1 Tax=Alicyclobacillus shizuokensis TaxID=392014 RepID=UPI00082DCCF2|nr:hypothetical protein [Alicyclobacillus shizuokensis]